MKPPLVVAIIDRAKDLSRLLIPFVEEESSTLQLSYVGPSRGHYNAEVG